MCDPITMGVVSAGLGVAQAVGGFMQAGQEAANQTAYYNQNKSNAQAAFSSEQDTLQQRQVQEQKAEAERSYDMNQEYVKARESMENDAAQTGAAGLSIEGLMGDLDQQEAQRQARSDQNLEWTLEELQANKEASGDTYVSRVDSVQKGVKPSFGNLAIGIVGAGMQGMNTYQSLKAKNK